MKQRLPEITTRMAKVTSFFVGGVVLGVIFLYVLFRLIFKGHVYPGVSVGEISLTGMTRAEVVNKLQEATSNSEIKLVFNSYEWSIPKNYFEFQIEETANEAYRYGRRTNWRDFLSVVLRRNEKVKMNVTVNESGIDAWVDTIAPTVEIVPTEATVKVNKGKIQINNGTDGTLIDREVLKNEIRDTVTNYQDLSVDLKVRSISKQLNEKEIEQLTNNAEAVLPAKIELTIDQTKTELSGEMIVALLSSSPSSAKVWSESSINEYVSSLATTYNRESVNAKFSIENGRAKEFSPSKDGITIQIRETASVLEEALNKTLKGDKLAQVEVKLDRSKPEIETENVNQLGIVKRIGVGESYYAHSIPGRIHNVGLTSSKITGVIVPPGEEFSFNAAVGDISSATGFAPAYVIKNGRTELGDGGGVCQVSTTVFRAAMSAGLPITERWAHAYRVGYYEQKSEPGIDATIFSPSKDFRFLNDTPGHILVQAINDSKNLHLIVEIYGTDDGRKSEISKVKLWGQTAPPPDLYQDDPTLPLGKIKQVDWSAWGAKTTFDYKVTRNGETIFEKSFPSTYRAWQNVYLRGTKTD